MDRLQCMEIFIRVADLASFTKASEEFNLPRASVSNAVAQLETQLGTRLLQRTTRQVHLTQDGSVFYERCRHLLEEMEDIQSVFSRSPSDVRGRIRVDLPTQLAKHLLIPNLFDFSQQYPAVDIELSCTDRRVDMIEEGIDCLIRVGTLTDSNLIARPIGQMRIVNLVSPAYVARYGFPDSLEALGAHKLIHYVPSLGGKADQFEYWDGNQYRSLPVPCGITVNNAEAYSQACLAGLGIIQAPYVGAKHYIDSGDMLEVLSQFEAEPMPVTLIYPNRRNLAKRVQLFMDWLTQLTKEYLQLDEQGGRTTCP